MSVQVAVAFMSNQLSTVLQGRGNGIKILNVERVYVNFFFNSVSAFVSEMFCEIKYSRIFCCTEFTR